MKRLAYFAAACAVVAGGLFAFASLSLTETAVRDAVVERIEAFSGYEVDIAGDSVLALFPVPRFELHNVTIRSDDTGDGEFARIDSLNGTVSVLPLLIGRLEVGEFVLLRPTVNLVVDAEGRPNWLPPPRGKLRAAIDADTADIARTVQIGSFRILDGSAVYFDRRNFSRGSVSDLNVTIAWPTLTSALAANGSLSWRGQHVEIFIDAGQPIDFLRRGTTTANARIDSELASIRFEGKAHLTSDPQFEGSMSLTSAVARDFLRWTGTPLDDGSGLEKLSLSARVNLVPSSISLSDVDLKLDGNEAEGGLAVSRTDSRTEWQGTLAFDALDLNVYRSAGAAARTPLGAAAFMLEPVDLSALRMITADIRVSAGTVDFGELSLGRTAGTVTIRNGILDVGIGEAELYGGSAQGTLVAKPAPEGTRVKASFKVAQTDISALLSSVLGVEPLSGTGNVRGSLTSSGQTVGEIVSRLTGEARLEISNGALDGIDAVKLLDSIEAGRVEGWPAAKGETRIDTLTATFKIVDGKAATEDFRMVGPNIEIDADGEIRLISASVAGNGTADLRASRAVAVDLPTDALSVPFVIEGPMVQPSIYPDPLWLLNRSTASPEEIGQFRKDLDQKKPEDIVEDLLRRGIDLSPDLKSEEVPLQRPQQ